MRADGVSVTMHTIKQIGGSSLEFARMGASTRSRRRDNGGPKPPVLRATRRAQLAAGLGRRASLWVEGDAGASSAPPPPSAPSVLPHRRLVEKTDAGLTAAMTWVHPPPPPLPIPVRSPNPPHPLPCRKPDLLPSIVRSRLVATPRSCAPAPAAPSPPPPASKLRRCRKSRRSC